MACEWTQCGEGGGEPFFNIFCGQPIAKLM